MKTKQLFIIALRAIKHHKGRSILTSLGIIIGVASIISLLAIGQGAEDKVKEEILAWGTNAIFVQAGRMDLNDIKDKMRKTKPPKPLTYNDAKSLGLLCPHIKYISPVCFSSQTIKYQSRMLKTEIKGGNEQFIAAIGRSLKLGSSFFKEHVHNGSRVIVLGAQSAQELFKGTYPIGQVVQINQVQFTVIGVLKKLKTHMNAGFYDANLDTIMPISTVKKYIQRSNDFTINSVCISTNNPEDIQEVVRQVTRIVRTRHMINSKEPNDFTVIDQQSMLKAAQASAGVLTLFLLIVAIISLLIGGIGVMNIMLVSVGERTQEIGIRMALGATQGAIMQQFLLEALVLCLGGGLIGICVGILAPIITSLFTGWLIVIRFSAILIAFSAIVAIGIIFGYYPAAKAARLNPVDALQDQ